MNSDLLIWAIVLALLLVPYGISKFVSKPHFHPPKQVKKFVLVVFILAVTGFGIGSVYILVQGLMNDNLSGVVTVPTWLPLAFYGVIGLTCAKTLGEALQDLKKLRSKR